METRINKLNTGAVETCPSHNLSPVAASFQSLKSRIEKLYDSRVWNLTEACMSVVVCCLLEDIANPMGLVLVGSSSTEKTTVLDFFADQKWCLRVDKFTPASFLTQAAKVNSKRLKDVDLLTKIPYRTLLIPELAPTFNQPKEILLENYGVLARVFDGRGLTNCGGVQGLRSVTGDYIFCLLGATTPLSQTAWSTMGKVGSRLLFLNVSPMLSTAKRMDRGMQILQGRIHYSQKRRIARDQINSHLQLVFSSHTTEDYKPRQDTPEGLETRDALIDHCGYLPRVIVWDREQDEVEVIRAIALVAELVTRARSEIRHWTDKSENGESISSAEVDTEGVDRLVTVLYNLARGHAIVAGRYNVTKEDLPVVLHVAISCLPDDRRKVVEFLLVPRDVVAESSRGVISTTDLVRTSGHSDKSAKSTIMRLHTLGVGRCEPGKGTRATVFRLSEEYRLLFSESIQRAFLAWRRRGL